MLVDNCKNLSTEFTVMNKLHFRGKWPFELGSDIKIRLRLKYYVYAILKYTLENLLDV